jgi:hypothetical protein
VRFRLDHADGTPDFYDGVPGLAAMRLVEFAGMTEQMSEQNVPVSEQVRMFKEMFEFVLTEDSAERFLARMSDKNDPIDFEQINDLMPWIMEQYGMRPTQPSSLSSNGSESPDSGTSSTPGVPNVELISTPSLPIASST